MYNLGMESEYSSALDLFVDEDRFIGRDIHPTPGTDGNPILTLATALFVKRLRNEFDKEDAAWFAQCVESLSSPHGLWYKKPRTKDEITHDDLLGIAALAALTNHGKIKDLARDIVYHGESHNWVLSCTGKYYWDADCKPWHKAFYRMAVGQELDLFSVMLMAGSIIIDALGDIENASNHRLTWMMLRSIQGRSVIIDWAARIWKKRIFGAYRSAKRILTKFYGESFPIAKFCPE